MYDTYLLTYLLTAENSAELQIELRFSLCTGLSKTTVNCCRMFYTGHMSKPWKCRGEKNKHYFW